MGIIVVEGRSYTLVLHGQELPSGISIEEAVRKFGLKEGDKLALWARIVGGLGFDPNAVDNLATKWSFINRDSKGLKKFLLKDFIITQLQEYINSGNRLYDIKHAGQYSGINSGITSRKYAKEILRELPLLKKLGGTDIIYDLIFGNIMTTYRDIKLKCSNNGFKLKTTATEWFNLLKTTGIKRVGSLKVKIECRARHISYKEIDRIGQKNRKGNKIDCYSCAKTKNKYTKELNMYQNILRLAADRHLELISFKNIKDLLLETEFLELLHDFKNKLIKGTSWETKVEHLNLMWKCQHCGYTFKNTIYTMLTLPHKI